jgi:hypothetical protein
MHYRSGFLATTILIGEKSSTSCLIARHLDEKSRDCKKNTLDTFVSPYRTRNSHPSNYNLTIKHKQDYFRKSYFIRSALLWNDLPSDLKDCSSFPSKSKLIN